MGKLYSEQIPGHLYSPDPTKPLSCEELSQILRVSSPLEPDGPKDLSLEEVSLQDVLLC